MIIISLTTSPTRINYIKPVIDSILNQSQRPDMIIINLPKIFKRTGDRFSSIPYFILNQSIIKINWVNDVGPATKIIPIKDFNFPDDTIIISIDDDIIYSENFIKEYIKISLKYPYAVLTGNSFISATQHQKLNLSGSDGITHVQLLEGFSGVLYRAKFLKYFNQNDYKLLHSNLACYLADDLFLSNYLTKNNIPILLLQNSSISLIPQEFGYQSDALQNGADGIVATRFDIQPNDSSFNITNYRNCIKHLKLTNDYYLDTSNIKFLN